MGRTKGCKDTKPRARRRTKEEMRLYRESRQHISKYGKGTRLDKDNQIDERDCIIAEVILRKRELELSELEALMQVAPNGVTPSQIYRRHNADEQWILAVEPVLAGYEYLDSTYLSAELKSFARHNVGAIIYDEEE